MGEIVEGVIHGKTIELAVDPGLQATASVARCPSSLLGNP